MNTTMKSTTWIWSLRLVINSVNEFENKTNNANDGSASQYDTKDKNYTWSSKKIISVHEDTYQSNFEQINHKEGNAVQMNRAEVSNKFTSLRTAQNPELKCK